MKKILIGAVVLSLMAFVLTRDGNPPPEETVEPTPTNEEGATNEEEARNLSIDFVRAVETSFAHVAPGEYSEVYVSVQELAPGTAVTVTLSGPSVDAPNTQTITTDDLGTAHFTFRVFSYGSYTARVHTGDTEADYVRSIVVN